MAQNGPVRITQIGNNPWDILRERAPLSRYFWSDTRKLDRGRLIIAIHPLESLMTVGSTLAARVTPQRGEASQFIRRPPRRPRNAPHTPRRRGQGSSPPECP
jgi:hypothetical protein